MITQQGDVIFHLEKIPEGKFSKIKTNVIQEGEATGHAHRLHDGEYEFIQDTKTKERYLRVVKDSVVRHEEHKPITLPPGDYRIGIVREYDHFDEEVRAVVD